MAQIEVKPVAAGAGGGFGLILGNAVLWVLGVTVWHIPFTATRAGDAIGAVPQPVSALLLFLTTVIAGLIAGFAAPHTFRTDLTQKEAQQPVLVNPPTPPTKVVGKSTS